MTPSITLNPAYSLASFQDSKAVSLYKNISLALVFMSTPSLLVDKIVFSTLGNLSLGNGLIFLNLLWLAGISLKTSYFDRLQKTIFTYLLLVILYFLAVWLAVYDVNLTGTGPRAIIRVFFHGLCFFLILNDPRFDIKRFSRFMLNFAVLLSIGSLILYYGYLFGFLSIRAVHPPGYGHDQTYFEGFGGYLNTYNYSSRFGHQFRSQSYFSEPTNFAQFLMMPLFLGWEVFRRQKNTRNLVTLGLLAWAFFLTYSVANFFGIFTTLIVYALFRRGDSITFIRKLRVIVFNIILLGAFVYAFHLFYIGTNAEWGSSVMAKGTTENVLNRFERFKWATSVLKYTLFGDLSFRQEFRNNPGLIGSAIIDGGLIVCGLLIALLVQLYSKVFRAIRKSSSALVFIGSVGFMVGFFWDGQFHENFFLFLVALLTTYLKHDNEGHELV